MDEQQREIAMRKLAAIDRQIEELTREFEDDWNNSRAELSIIEDDLEDLEVDREKILQQFPEVRSWDAWPKKNGVPVVGGKWRRKRELQGL